MGQKLFDYKIGALYNKAASGTSEHNLLPQVKRPRKIPARKYYSRSKAQRSVPPTGSKVNHA